MAEVPFALVWTGTYCNLPVKPPRIIAIEVIFCTWVTIGSFYEIQDETLLVRILKVQHRREVYRRIGVLLYQEMERMNTLDSNAYDSTIDTPGNWWFHACGCRSVARTLKSEHGRMMQPGFNPFRSEVHAEVAEQLAGSALENALKAAIVGLNPRVPGSDPGTLRHDLVTSSTHALVTLAQRAGIKIDDRRTKKFEHLTNVVAWQSRYPVARSAGKTGTTWATDLDETFTIVDEIMNEVEDMLNQAGYNLNNPF